MTHSLLPHVLIDPPQSADAAIIWLHGLGANGHDFEPALPHLQLPETLAVRFIFPHAPAHPVTINGGYVMPSWYDILALTELREINDDDLARSTRQITDFVDDQIAKGIAPGRIILIGFSQGGAVAFHTALSYPQRIGGLIALSTYLPAADTLSGTLSPANRSLEITMAHGSQDPVVPKSASLQAKADLEALNFKVSWHEYPMGHEVCLPELAHIGQWIKSYLDR